MAKVTLISHTPDPEKTVAAAAKLCYAQGSIENLLDNLTDEKVDSFLHMLMEIGHESPIEHVSFTFGIEGVSRSLLAQLTRHRIASYSVQSQRYVSECHFDFVTPPEIAVDPSALKIFEDAMTAAGKAYTELCGILADKHQLQLISEGVEEKEAARRASKMAMEDARFVLPNACGTKLMVTMNARSLLNFFEHRLCMRAQWEIRQLAEDMLSLVKEAAPTIFSKAGPPCVRGACPEGKMSCGNAADMRKRYGVRGGGQHA